MMKLKKILLASAIVASLAGIMATSSFAEEDTFNAVWNPQTNSVDITGCKAPAEGGRKTVLVVETVDGKGSVLGTVAESNIMQIDEQGEAYTSVYVGADKLTAGNYYEIRIGGDGSLQRMVFQVPTSDPENPYKSSTRLIGDPDGNNKINNTDATYIINHVVKISLLTGESLQAADVNADNKVNNTDATYLINKVVGIDTTTIDGKKTVGDRTEYVPETK